MADTDLIARVYLHGIVDKDTLAAFQTSLCYVPSRVRARSSPQPLPAYPREERQPTESSKTHNDPELDNLPHVELRFGNTPRFRSGFVFGHDPDSDVVLPRHRGVGQHHFTLSFDEAKRPVVKDWGSLQGTEITYGKQGHGVRRGFQWIVGGERVVKEKWPIIITIPADPIIQLHIVVARHDIESPAYIDKVDRFLQGTAATEDLFSSLDIQNRPDTERPTGTHTPSTGPIHLRKRLGEGSFAVVTRYWNVSTGEEYALKKPSAKAIQNRRVRVADWKNENHIMSLISHPHVVQLFWSDFNHGPRLCLEYVPGGSLAQQQNISAAECLSVLQQCLSALEYLHGSDPPIVHRDIKADNILVQYREAHGIYVKFGDFGLAREYDNLSTICGNFPHLAPEVYENYKYIEAGGEGRVSYTSAVDVWSLGVVVYELLCPPPEFKQQYIFRGAAWANKLINKFEKDLEKRPDELRQFLLEAMVVLLPEQRWSAQACRARADRLPTPAWDQCETPTTASYTNDDERTIIRNQAEPSIIQGLETSLWQSDTSDYTTLSTDAGRYDRSAAPTPRPSVPASRSSRKRPTVSTSSTSERHRKRREHGSSRGANSASRQQRDHFLGNRTQESLPPNALEDSGQDKDDWNQGGDDNSHTEFPHPTNHLSTSPIGLEVEGYTLLQSQVDYGGADQEVIDAAMMLQALSQHNKLSKSAYSSSGARRLRCPEAAVLVAQNKAHSTPVERSSNSVRSIASKHSGPSV